MITLGSILHMIITHSTDAGKFVISKPLGMIVGPCFGYLVQCYTISKERNADGFSPFICLILLIANILRVFWW